MFTDVYGCDVVVSEDFNLSNMGDFIARNSDTEKLQCRLKALNLKGNHYQYEFSSQREGAVEFLMKVVSELEKVGVVSNIKMPAIKNEQVMF